VADKYFFTLIHFLIALIGWGFEKVLAFLKTAIYIANINNFL
jgi:hypothetical protein